MRDLGYVPPFNLSLFKVRPPVTAMNLYTRFSQGTNQGGMLYDWFQNEKLMKFLFCIRRICFFFLIKLFICGKAFCDLNECLTEFVYIYLFAELGDNANII